MSFRYNNKNGYFNYPGPGSYEHQQTNVNGRYCSSLLPNSVLNKFGSEKRFFTSGNEKAKNPGPGTYESENMIKGTGVIYNSRYKSYFGKTIGMRLAKIGEKLITPGPGAYDHFSDFSGFGRYKFQVNRSKSQEKGGKNKSAENKDISGIKEEQEENKDNEKNGQNREVNKTFA